MTTYHCDPSKGWENMARTLSSARPSDIVHLRSGIYTGHTALRLPTGAKLVGEAGVRLRNEGDGPVLQIENEACTVTGIRFESTRPGQICIQIQQAVDVLVSKCEFEGNGVAEAAVVVVASRDVRMVECTAGNFAPTKNEFVGAVSFRSSDGEIRACEFHQSRTGSGILIGRAPNSRDAPSKVTLANNRCHDNKGAGIDFVSSNGRAEGNECWGSRSSGGILIGRGANSPDAPSEVTLANNRCHDNEQSGIAFLSSNGRAEGNECWGSRRSGGIVIERDANSLDAPSEVTLANNRCHDNELAGIAFGSGNGRAEGNECWGSRDYGGIVIQRDLNSPDAPSEVTLANNRCHDNESAGIIFFSSNGRAEGNECWGSRSRGGIVIQRGSNSRDAPSEVTLANNRCHDNEQSGIAFLSSDGRAEGNECFDNGFDGVTLEGSPHVVVHSHRQSASCPIQELESQYLRKKPLGGWALDHVGQERAAIPLADYLVSGCRDCFRRFWAARRNAPAQEPIASLPKNAITHTTPAAPGQGRIGVYKAQGRTQPVDLRSVATEDNFWGSDEPASPGLPALTALLARFGARRARALDVKRLRDGPRAEPPKWSVGFVSSAEVDFDAWLNNPEARGADLARGLKIPAVTPPPRIVQFSLRTYYAANRETGKGGFVEKALLQDKGFWSRCLARVDAWLFMPAVEFLAALTVLAALTALMSIGLVVFEFNIDILPASWDRATVIEKARVILSKAMTEWHEHLPTMMIVTLVWLAAFVFLANRSLPRSLHFSVERLLTLLEGMNVPGTKWLLEQLKKADISKSWWGRLAQRLGQSETARRAWLRRKLYGYRLFAMFRLKPAPGCIVAVRDVDVPTAVERGQLRELLGLCPSNQAVFLVTQMSGLSMLTSAYLDVWYPVGEGPVSSNVEGFVVHDFASARITRDAVSAKAPPIGTLHHALPGIAGLFGLGTMLPVTSGSAPLAQPSRSGMDERRRDEATLVLNSILGWAQSNPSIDDPQGATSALRPFANSLLDKKWAFMEILPTIVLGSTPYAHMLISRSNVHDFEQYKESLFASINLYSSTFNWGKGSIAASTVEESDRFAQRSDGLLVVDTNAFLRRERHWIGRVGYRVQLADAIRNLFHASGQSHEVESYLAEMTACGEMHHLTRMQTLMASLDDAAIPPDSRERHRQLIPLHMEAALFLLDESLEWKRSDSVKREWVECVRIVLRAPRSSSSFAPIQNARLCTMVLKVSDQYRSRTGLDGQEARDFEHLLADPFGELRSDAVQNNWQAFLVEAQGFLLVLAKREVARARAILSGKLSQDWYHLPERYKTMLKQKLPMLGGSYLEKMAQATTADHLFDLALRLRERPALVVHGISMLAGADVRYRLNRDGLQKQDYKDELGKIADAILRLSEVSITMAAEDTVPPFYPGPDAPALKFSSELLLNEGRLRELARALKSGTDAQVAQDTDWEEIEGLALGVHGKLHGVLTKMDIAEQDLIADARSRTT